MCVKFRLISSTASQMRKSYESFRHLGIYILNIIRLQIQFLKTSSVVILRKWLYSESGKWLSFRRDPKLHNDTNDTKKSPDMFLMTTFP